MASQVPWKPGPYTGSETDRLKKWETGDYLPLAYGGLGGSAASTIAACGLISAVHTSTANQPLGYAALDSSSRISTAQAPLKVVYTDLAQSYSVGVKQTMTAGPSSSGFRLGPSSSDPSVLVDGDVWYNSTLNKFRKRENGATSNLSDPTPAGSNTHVQFNDSGALGGVSDLTFNKSARRLLVGTSTNHGILSVNPAAGDPGTPQNGDLWYDSTAGKFRKREAGVSSDLSVAGTPGGSSTYVQFNSSGAFAGDAGLVFDNGTPRRLTIGYDGGGPAVHGAIRLYPAIGDPGTVFDGDVWYNSTTGKFRKRENGVTSDLAGAGGTPAGSPTEVQFNNSGSFGGDPALTFDSTNKRFGIGYDNGGAAVQGILNLFMGTGDPSTPVEGDIWYNGALDLFRCRDASATRTLLDTVLANIANGYGALDSLAMLPVANQRPRQWDKHCYTIQAVRNSSDLSFQGLRTHPATEGAFTSVDDSTGIWHQYAGTSTSSIHDPLFDEWLAGWVIDETFRIRTDPTSVDQSVIWVGLFDFHPGYETDPIYKNIAAFRYDYNQDGVKWSTYSCGAGALAEEKATTVDCDANTEYKLRIYLNPGIPVVYFYINDVLVNTHTSRVPTINDRLGYYAGVDAYVGSTKALLFSRLFTQTN